MDRRSWLVSLSASLSAVSLAGCSLPAGPEPTAEPDPETPKPSPSASGDSSTSPTTTASGDGTGRVEFTTNGGLAIIATSTTGRDPVGVTLTDGSSTTDVQGTTLDARTLWTGTIPRGSWTIDVDSNTNWQLEITTPSTGTLDPPAGQTSSGIGFDWFPVTMDGETPSTATYRPAGENGRFRVTVFTAGGEKLGQLYDTSNGLEDAPAAVTYSGVGWVIVRAGGQYALGVG